MGSGNYKYLLITSSNFPKGGAGAAYLDLFCRGMLQAGYSVNVFLTRGHAFGENKERILRKNTTPEGIPYTYLGLSRRPSPPLFKLADDFLTFFRLLILLPKLVYKRKETKILVYHIDLIHSILIYLTASLFRIKVFTFVPEYFYKAQFKGFNNKIKWFNFILTFDLCMPFSDGLIVFSSFLNDVFLKKGIDKNRIFIQPNLTDFEFWTPTGKMEEFTVGYSGSPGKKDGLPDLFRAVSLLKDKFDINLLVVGDSTFGKSMIPALKTECEELGISTRVVFTGLVDYVKVKEYLSLCRILAVTRPATIQTKAGFPTKLGEYMALGKPVLATNFGDVEKYFTDGEDIVLADCGDPVSIAGKLEWMLSNSLQTKKIACAGRDRAIELLEYASSVKRMSGFFDQ